MLELFNTEKREKSPVGKEGAELTMYTCGPTVYNYAHIGNFRTYVFEDLLRRTLKFFGYGVRQAMNLTDVDDKTIRGALEKGVPLDAYTKTFKEAFFNDIKVLGIEPVEVYPAATDHIPEMIEMIEQLIQKGFAYVGDDGNVFFRIAKFPSYGRLSHLKLDDLIAGASDRIDDEYDKENISDFVLWKTYDPERDGDVKWEAPFGEGRPGWHIECSAMAVKHLGHTLDIHVGGVDNIFPHHDNEIAQSECCTGKPFARHWLHAEHLIVDGKKMSKSSGNFYTLRDLLKKGYTGREVRYMLLSTHYRTQLNFTLSGLDGARSALGRFDALILRLQGVHSGQGGDALQTLEQAQMQFKSALGDDLNISVALAALFDFSRDINRLMDEEQLSKEEAEQILEGLKQINRVLNIFVFDGSNQAQVPIAVQEALVFRNDARARKDWKMADHYRNVIEEAGYTIEDSKDGSRVKKR